MGELKPQEVQAAIAYFEDAVRESDEIIADCSEALQAELTEQKQHFVVALDVMRRPAPENKALTVGDHIRSMDNEELAGLLMEAEGRGYNDDSIADHDEHGYPIKMLDWLNRPYARRPEQEATP